MHAPRELGIRHLRGLVAIADHGDVPAAARVLGVTRDKLEALLWRLQSHPGGPLFDTVATRLVPSPRGEEVVAAARGALTEFDALVADGQRAERGTLRLVGDDGLLPHLAGVLAGDRGRIAITSRSCPAQAAVDAVRDGEADLAVLVRWPHLPLDVPVGLSRRDVGGRSLDLIVARTHRLAGEDVVDLADVAGEPWCVRADPDTASAVFAACARSGFVPDVRHRLAGDAEVARVVAAGAAVALVATMPHPATELVRLPLRHPTSGRVVVVWSSAVDVDLAGEVADDLAAALHAGPAWAAPDRDDAAG